MMTMAFPKCTALLLALGVTTHAGALAQTAKVGVNAAVLNDISQLSVGDSDARPAAEGGDVRLDDTITSGADSQLQVLLLDETVFTVGPNAEIAIDRFVYDPDRDTGEMAASVTKGAFRFMSGRTAKRPGAAEVESPVASMGVRGTIVEIAVGPEAIAEILGEEAAQLYGGPLPAGATLFALRGPGTGNSGLNKDGAADITSKGGTVTLTKANTAVLVPTDDGPLIGPFALSSAAVQRFSTLLRTTPDGAPGDDLPPIAFIAGLPPTDEPLIVDIQPEDDQILDRPILICPIADGVPVSDGGLFLDGRPDQNFDDFGGLDCGQQ